MSADDESQRKLEKPVCDVSTVVAFVNANWTLPGGPIDPKSVKQLNSYDDRNFFGVTVDGVHSYTLKVHNGVESVNTGLLAAQTAMMRHLQKHGVPAPVPMRSNKSIDYIGSINDANMKKPIHDDVCFLELESVQTDSEHTKSRFHAVRVLTWLEGELAERSKRVVHNPEFLRDVGVFFGKMSVALKSFQHPGCQRHHLWDTANALEVKQFISAIKDSKNLEVALNVLEDFERIVAPHGKSLRRSPIHGDLNDQNVLVVVILPSVADEFFSPGQRPVAPMAKPSAILDFGDIVVSWCVNEIAVAAAYFSLGSDDPVGAIAEIVTGYESQFPLTETERRILPTLIQSRLVCSVVCGAYSASKDPANEQYLLMTQKSGWVALRAMRECGDDLFRKRLDVSRLANERGEPVGGVTKWIETQ
tara:strand:+ start:6457 stop:7710 length:1254 start_codon:yes stop_codon:yes gene_type:complete